MKWFDFWHLKNKIWNILSFTRLYIYHFKQTGNSPSVWQQIWYSTTYSFVYPETEQRSQGQTGKTEKKKLSTIFQDSNKNLVQNLLGLLSFNQISCETEKVVAKNFNFLPDKSISLSKNKGRVSPSSSRLYQFEN